MLIYYLWKVRGNNMYTALCYFFIYLSEALILAQYTSKVFILKRKSLHRYILLTILYFFLYLISFMHLPILNAGSFFIINFLYINFSTEAKLSSILFHTSITAVFSNIGESLVLAVFSRVAPNIYTHIKALFIAAFISKLLYFLALYFISRKFSSSKKQDHVSFFENVFLCLVPILSTYIMINFALLCISYEIPAPYNYMIILSTFFILLINILIFGLYEHIKQKNTEIAELKLQSQRDADSVEYYKMLVQQDEKQKVLIHDIKKHLNAIAALNEQQDSTKIAAYLEHVLGSSELQHSVRVCENDLLNALLCRYQKLCLTEKITLHLDIRSKCIDFVNYDDLSVLFGNLMDNAVESAEKMVNPFINLNVFKKDNTSMTFITLINSCRVNPIDKNGNLLPTKKSNPQFHGFGIRSIQNIVNKYKGQMTVYFDAPTKTFHTIIMLQNN